MQVKRDLRNRLQVGQQPEAAPVPKADLTSVKVKTIEEIRAEKMAKSQSPKHEPSQDDQVNTKPISGKREAQQNNNRQIRIKRPRVTTDDAANPTPTPDSTTKIENQKPVPKIFIPSSEPAATDVDYLEGEDEDEAADDGNGGTLNDDELLLEIDNMLGD